MFGMGENVGELREFGQHCLGWLRAIHDAVSTEDFAERRVRPFITPAAAGTVDVATVPVGEAWALESLAGVGVATVQLNASGRLRSAYTFDGAGTEPGNGVVFEAGEVITVTVSAAIELALQFKARQPEPRIETETGHVIDDDRETVELSAN